MSSPARSLRSALHAAFALTVLLAPLAAAQAADLVRPMEVAHLQVDKSGSDLVLSWDAVSLDQLGATETVDHYRVYRDTARDFVPDRSGGTNLLGTTTSTSFTDTGALNDPTTYYYRVSAVDAAGNEGNTKPVRLDTAPVPTVSWTSSTIDLQWIPAKPEAEVGGYRVYYGNASRAYDQVDVLGNVTSHSLTGLDLSADWFIAVSAVDLDGNETHFSYEFDVNADAGRVDFRLHDQANLCWGAGKCPPRGNEIQRRNGQEVMIPVWFPQGNWVNVDMTWTVESRLCDDPIAPDKCGDQNPGWNPCGDPWDRTASTFLVMDDCIDAGANCYGRNGNIELLRAITPFGTDAPPPDGSGEVGPRVWNFDLTPLTPALSGQKHVGVMISTFVSRGWWASLDFHFSEDPAEASPEPPADGVAPALFADNSADVTQGLSVTVPATATQVWVRLFTTGHGGNTAPDCADPADEFCQRTNRILVDGAPAWQTIPWRSCCFGALCTGCIDWNACGFPSCTFDRSGWCPGLIACHQDDPCDQDIEATTWLPPGGTYQIDYEILNRYGSWAKSLVVYWYE